MLTLINWALGAGVYVVVALSLERYISIVFPMHFREWNSPRRATNAIAIAYIIPALLYVPYAITRYKSIEKWDENVNATIYRIDDHEVYRTIPWQKTYANRSRLRSFVKRTQSAITRDKDSSNPPTSSPKAVDSHLSKTSRTGQAEPETVDVHLASGEESLSDGKESDSLIKYGAVAKLSTDTNGSTFL
ncbi:hypothetical protein RB195_021461 [Necator americanus]|uniref:G-protein coupled receptors family 1 profile domain-containing protein n=1 Tax=Necator americanus TaxID=51031 RepID=A0ABR1EBF0_NECAM